MQSTDTEFMIPSTVAEALQGIGREDSIFLGGGTATALLYKNRLIEPSRVIWLGNIAELKGISITQSEVRIGAMTSVAEIAGHSRLAGLLPGLCAAASVIGNARVRAMATLGGALAHADPRQDIPPSLIAVNATISIKSASSSREVSLSEFYEGFLETVLEPDELITEVIIPISDNRSSAYIRYTPTSEGDYPTVGVGSSLTVASDMKTVVSAQIVLCGVGAVPMIATEAANSLVGTTGDDQALRRAASLVSEAIDPQDDERGTADYKTEMSKVFAYRSLKLSSGN
ncbi:MAG: hypothetical protein HKL84_04095 [Acidimicrobiaceae bacterium]|nr:hypothetical protein [Acidimicrobiaceae bacterium]